MKTDKIISKQWIGFGASAGIIANLLFPILVLVDLPSYLQVFFVGLFGVFFSLSGFAIHHTMKHENPTAYSKISALLVFVSGFLYSLMLMVQLTFRGYIENFYSQANGEEQTLLNWIIKTVDPVHLGMQFSNDFFTAVAMILFAIVMYKHRFFGKFWSISAALIAIVLIVIKCYSFPVTPDEVGIPYVIGPLISLWFLAVCVQCLRKRQLI